MDHEWNEAKQELVNAGVVINAVYAMEPGVTGALATGLKTATAQTGGFFVNASHQGVRRVEKGELSGYYEIEVRVPADLPVGTHAVAICGATRKDIVLNGSITVAEEGER